MIERWFLAAAFALAATAWPDTGVTSPADCDSDNGGLELAEGFCARVAADELGRARHLAVRGNGDVYVIFRKAVDGRGLAALRDTDGDGRYDRIERFGEVTGTGIAVRDDWLYAGADNRVVRYRLPEGDGLVPGGEPETVVTGFPGQGQHAAKSLAFDGEGHLFVNVGGPSNACQKKARTPGSPGIDPCPQLERHGGVWRFDAAATDQDHQRRAPFATGIRNAVALAWNGVDGGLYAVQHGRDQLHSLWPELFTVDDNAVLPAEEFLRLEEGDDFGWPYCYHDQRRGRKVLAPEYGGDGEKVGRCAEKKGPLVGFPGHWAPNDLLFYAGGLFPERYRGGAFIAFHGSWNRAPRPQAGYRVVFVPMEDGKPAGDWITFADGFKGAERIESSREAEYRPMGLTVTPDGELLVIDSQKGRLWAVRPADSP